MRLAVQLYTLRAKLAEDVPGTLDALAEAGAEEVELAGLYDRTAGDMRALLDAAGLKAASTHARLERLQPEPEAVLEEARTLGVETVIVPWVPTPESDSAADEVVGRIVEAGAAVKDAGLRFGYHTHGYEMVPSPDGTLFDTLAKALDPKLVHFQVDVFHTYHGGADPVALMTKYTGRVRSLHLKDIKKGYPRETGKGTATPDADVPVGTGQIDWPAVLRAAMKAGATEYYVEDESTDPLTHIPQSLAYLQGLKL